MDNTGIPDTLKRTLKQVEPDGEVITVGNQKRLPTIEATQNIIDSLVGHNFGAGNIDRLRIQYNTYVIVRTKHPRPIEWLILRPPIPHFLRRQ